MKGILERKNPTLDEIGHIVHVSSYIGFHSNCYLLLFFYFILFLFILLGLWLKKTPAKISGVIHPAFEMIKFGVSMSET